MEEQSKKSNSIEEMQLYQNFVIFQTKDGKVNIDVFFKDETLWLTQKAISSLYGKDRSVISKHLKNIFDSGELDENMVCANFAHTTIHGAIDGKTQEKEVKFPLHKDNGKFSMLEAKLKAETEYEKFRIVQDKNYISDFDREIQNYFSQSCEVAKKKSENERK